VWSWEKRTPACNGPDTGTARRASEQISRRCQITRDHGYAAIGDNLVMADDADGVSRERIEWDSIDWDYHEKVVRRLQERIVKATQEGNRDDLR